MNWKIDFSKDKYAPDVYMPNGEKRNNYEELRVIDEAMYEGDKHVVRFSIKYIDGRTTYEYEGFAEVLYES